MKKTFMQVTTRFYDDGTVRGRLDTVYAESRPENRHINGTFWDTYLEYCDTEREAVEWLKGAMLNHTND